MLSLALIGSLRNINVPLDGPGFLQSYWLVREDTQGWRITIVLKGRYLGWEVTAAWFHRIPFGS